jgi:hypothetical protein
MDEFEQAGSRLIRSERVAARAVIVPEGEDPTPYLLEAGIIEPIRLPFTDAAEGGSAASIGDGETPGLEATLELDGDAEEADWPGLADEQENAPEQKGGEQSGETPDLRTVNLPEAFGARPMAPVWRPR